MNEEKNDKKVSHHKRYNRNGTDKKMLNGPYSINPNDDIGYQENKIIENDDVQLGLGGYDENGLNTYEN